MSIQKAANTTYSSESITMDSRLIEIEPKESDKLNGLLKLKQEFSRYFFSVNNIGVRSGFGFGFGFGFGLLSGGDRNTVSTIIENRVYLSNLPSSTKPPFSWMENINNKEAHAALVVSCVDIKELAESGLLLEPSAKRIQYHVVAMQDVTAHVGCKDHIYDALAIMSHYADRNKPIHIHCYSGVGRSAMMTALHLVHRYLLNDPVIKACMDELFDMLEMQNQKLNCDDKNYLQQLYDVAASFVSSKRKCCQFNNYERNELAMEILKEVQDKIKKGEALIGHRDENYYFLAELSQSCEFKKLQHYYYNSFMSNQVFVDDFINNLLLDQKDWFRRLEIEIENIHAKKTENSPAVEWETILIGVKDVIIRLSEQWPKACYGKQVLASLKDQPGLLDNTGMQLTVESDDVSQQNYSCTYR